MPQKFDPLKINLYQGIFSAICEEMGAVLQRTAFSPNINERRDFSCALFDQKGDLLAQAAHIPVHLGSAQDAVKAVLKGQRLLPGDMVILNDPFAGGTHLPDLTLIAPIFAFENDRFSETPVFYVCNRAHHADIGGQSPGSMPLAKSINEEGLRLSPSHLLKNNQVVSETLQRILSASRTPNERRGDLAAQIGANKYAQRRMQESIVHYSLKELKKQGRQLQAYSQSMMLNEIKKIPVGEYRFEDYLEAPAEVNPLLQSSAIENPDVEHQLIRLVVKLIVTADGITVDLSESAAQTPTSLNTVLAVTRACVLYVFRAIAEEDFPLNAGCLEPFTIIAPEGSILNAVFPAAVSAGNVETSQRLVDTLLGALSKALPKRIPAASCGSMNNVCIGGLLPDTTLEDKQYAYYETIAGGQGAALYGNGADGIHMHMTNTLNTPIEVLEHAYPIQIETYNLRRKSGGAGRFMGGEGIERAYRFLNLAKITLITERRLYPPYGLHGGGDGATGENILERGGEHLILPGKCTLDVKPGDIVRILTPGGGGFGKVGAKT